MGRRRFEVLFVRLRVIVSGFPMDIVGHVRFYQEHRYIL